MFCDAAVLEGVDVVDFGEEVERMSDEQNSLALPSKGFEDGIREESSSDVRVDCAERVVEENDVSVEIEGARYADL